MFSYLNRVGLLGLAAATFALFAFSALCTEAPVCFDDRLTIQLVAEEPQINTPTGIAVDARGRIWVIENNTHFTPKSYKGFASDRIQIFEDFAPDGRAQKVSTFADGFRNSMGLLIGKDGAVFFSTRSEIMLLRDTKNEGKADERKTLIKLDTAGDYPHNGLAGLALGPDGKLYFGLGENLGKPYSLIGSDGVTLKGGGEGGNVYRCELDGSKIERIATGFWNPWGLGFNSIGELFAVDNDPDSRPPCRLLHVVEGGDYGYKFKYGRKGIHPFVAWNGEIPGTLPMVSGTGEAPCAVYYCEAGQLLQYHGDLLVTCWADNVIQRFKMEHDGLSWKSRPEELIKGSVNFRPVGMVPAPDGSLVISDWVSSSYPVHGKGRIWRIKSRDGVNHFPAMMRGEETAYWSEMRRLPTMKESEVLNLALSQNGHIGLNALNYLRDPASARAIFPRLTSSDPFVFNCTANALARTGNLDLLLKNADDPNARIRLGVLLALRKNGDAAGKAPLAKWLLDPDLNVRFAAVQWVGEEGLKEFAPTLQQVIKMPMTRELFEGILATQSLLSGDKPDKGEYIESQMTQIFPSDKHPAHFRALALKNLRVDHPGMTVAKLKPLLESNDAELRAEAIKALALHAHPDAQPILRELAADEKLDVNLRADALAGLTRSAGTSEETKKLLLAQLAPGVAPALQREAVRALRAAAAQADVQTALRDFSTRLNVLGENAGMEMAEQILFALKAGGVNEKDVPGLVAARPSNEAEWAALLAKPNAPVDAAAGARIFYHTKGAQCFNCHKINGRGGSIGPDLSPIGKTTVRERILQSILDPAREVAPQFVQWQFVLKDGRRLAGVIVEENNGVVILGDSAGTITKIRVPDIDRRAVLKGSVMPDKLVDLLTQQELRDLIAFLIENK